MQTLNARALKEQAGSRLSQTACDHKKLTLIHTAIAIGASLAVTLLQLYLQQQVDASVGLSGLGTRAVLETAQLVLSYGVNIAAPFWTMGFLYFALRLARGEETGFRDMPEGFRRFGPVLRLLLLQGLLYMGAAFLCLYAGAFLFSITPLSAQLRQVMEPIILSGASMDEMINMVYSLPAQELIAMMLPAGILIGVLFLAVGGCLYYRFRMAEFIVMDKPGTGALMAMLMSGHMTKGYRLKLLRLDLSFWWFYLLSAVSVAATYADVLLPYLGIATPVSGQTLQLACYVIGCLIQLVVYWQFFSYQQTTYATAYEVLRQKMPAPGAPRQSYQQLPNGEEEQDNQ